MTEGIGRPILDDGTGPLTTTEARLLAERERARQEKAAQRARKKAEEQARADAPPPGGNVVPAAPSSLKALRRWLRKGHDLYSARKITSAELADALAVVEHGGTALLLLQRLQSGLTDGQRRPLPGRTLTVVPRDQDGAGA